MRNHGRIVLVLVSFALLLNTGCVFFHSWEKGQPIDETTLKNLIVGEETKQSVENRMGLPDEIIPLENGSIYRYNYSRSNTFILFIIGATTTENDKAFFTFNSRRILVDKRAQLLTKNLGWRLWPFGRGSRSQETAENQE